LNIKRRVRRVARWNRSKNNQFNSFVFDVNRSSFVVHSTIDNSPATHPEEDVNLRPESNNETSNTSESCNNITWWYSLFSFIYTRRRTKNDVVESSYLGIQLTLLRINTVWLVDIYR
jgi:hypothetical protein